MTVRVDALPELVDAWRELEQLAGEEGITLAIADFGGFRTAADTSLILSYKQQDYDAYAARERGAGRSPLPITGPWEDGSSRPIAPFGQSYHDYGAARDFVIVGRPAGMSVSEAELRVDDLAEYLGLDTGRSYGDRRHVELPISLQEARDRWAEYSANSISPGTAVWLLIALGVGVLATVRYASGLRSWH
ncbi:MAG: hypothetical protein ACREBE_01160 [bacterium]